MYQPINARISQGPIPALTGLRFAAAGLVLISHSIVFLLPFQGNAPDWHQYLRGVAGIGMPLFFVLSGFVIHYNYFATIERDRTRGVVNFFVARFARLYPLFLACIAFDLTFKCLYGQLPATTTQALPFYLTLTQSWVYLPMADQPLIFQFGVMPTVAWSISTEWFFYCAYPFLFFPLRRLQTPGQTLAAAAILVLFGVALVVVLGFLRPAINAAAADVFGPIAATNTVQSFYLWLLYFSPYVRILEFLLGCLCADLYIKTRDHPPSPREQRVALAATICAIVGAFSLLYVFMVDYRGFETEPGMPGVVGVVLSLGYCFGYAPFIAVIVFCCARYKNSIVSALSAPHVVLCGEASYSLYLLHLMVIYAFRFTVSPVVSVEVGIANSLMWLLTMATCIGLAIVSWKCLEIPARDWVRRALQVSGSRQGHEAALVSDLPGLTPIEVIAPSAALAPDLQQERRSGANSAS